MNACNKFEEDVSNSGYCSTCAFSKDQHPIPVTFVYLEIEGAGISLTGRFPLAQAIKLSQFQFKCISDAVQEKAAR